MNSQARLAGNSAGKGIPVDLAMLEELGNVSPACGAWLDHLPLAQRTAGV